MALSLMEAITSQSLTRFGPYELVRHLGGGGMGEVFEARHVELGKRVAIKVVHMPLAATGEAVQQVLREGRAAAAVHHPNVIEVLDVGVQRGWPFLVMELLEGEDLEKRLARTGPMGTREIIDLMVPVISGMMASHDAGVVHRDLKPSNIFLAKRHRGTEPVIVDFGISRSMNAGPATASARNIAGTIPYMAPERVRGSYEITAASDQYSLGVILYECATGGTPFWSEDRYELLNAIMTAAVVPPSELNPNLDPGFDALVLRALSRDPGARFSSTKALGVALLDLATDEMRRRWADEFGVVDAKTGGDVVVTAPPPPDAVPGVRRRWAGGIAWGLGIAAVAAITLGVGLRRLSPARPATAATASTLTVAPSPADSPSARTTLPAEVALPPVPTPLESAQVPVAASGENVATIPLARPVTSPPAKRRPPRQQELATPPPSVPTVERGTGNIPIVE
jgi:serine/threonine-protein kinase